MNIEESILDGKGMGLPNTSKTKGPKARGIARTQEGTLIGRVHKTGKDARVVGSAGEPDMKESKAAAIRSVSSDARNRV